HCRPGCRRGQGDDRPRSPRQRENIAEGHTPRRDFRLPPRTGSGADPHAERANRSGLLEGNPGSATPCCGVGEETSAARKEVTVFEPDAQAREVLSLARAVGSVCIQTETFFDLPGTRDNDGLAVTSEIAVAYSVHAAPSQTWSKKVEM